MKIRTAKQVGALPAGERLEAAKRAGMSAIVVAYYMCGDWTTANRSYLANGRGIMSYAYRACSRAVAAGLLEYRHVRNSAGRIVRTEYRRAI